MQTRPIIGLEIHVQLATRTKMFCRCPVEFAAEPNSLTCPVCLGMPGTLPVMNRQAVDFAIKAGLALGCQIAPFTKWDRKSYYYPDMPKNYQISQYDLPLSADGAFEIAKPDGSLKKIGIIRAHLEEDAGKNLHEGLDHTRVDLNRAGTPLLEIVTKPDLADADEAYTFCVELQRLVRYLGISEANMQKGQMRFEPNVNVAITADGVEHRTPICEIKNLNSFRSVRSAIQYEIDRQIAAWQADSDYTLAKKGKMNFGWDNVREVTEFQRGKEESHDYRYFPDPDLVPVKVDAAWLERLRGEIGELPSIKERRFIAEFGMTAKDCEVILATKKTGDSYEESVKAGADPRILLKQLMGPQQSIAIAQKTTIGELNIPPTSNSAIVSMIIGGEISPTNAKTLTESLVDNPGDAGERARDLNLLQVRDESATLAWVNQAFAENPQAVADALGDNPKKSKAAPGFLRGQIMKISQGKADPRLAGECIERKLNEMRSAPP